MQNLGRKHSELWKIENYLLSSFSWYPVFWRHNSSDAWKFKRLSRNNLRSNGGNLVREKTFHRFSSFLFICFLPSQLSFVRLGFRLLCVRLPVHCFAVYSVLRNKKTMQTSTATNTIQTCVITLCLFFAVLYKTTTLNSHILHTRENVNYDDQFLKFIFRILTPSYIFCLRYFWQW